MIIECLLALACFVFLAVLCGLNEHGKATGWFLDLNNERLFRKHFQKEGIMVFINHKNHEVSFVFSKKGTHTKIVSFAKALQIMKETKNGGIGKRLQEIK